MGCGLLIMTIVGWVTLGRAEGDIPKPNVLILLTDDQGWGDLGVQGAKDVGTPHLDALAREGVRFTSGYVAAPVCSPSRAGLITGRAPTRFGFEFNHAAADLAPFGLPAAERTLAERLREVGYATGHIGKWHLGCTTNPAQRPEGRGFDESLWFVGQKKLAPLVAYQHGAASAGTRPAGPAVVKNAAKLFPGDEAKAGEAVLAQAGYVDAAMGEAAGDFVTRHGKKGKPWFLYVALLTPHTPLDFPPGTENSGEGLEPRRRKCAAMIGELDRAVGQLLETLRATGQLDRTMIWFLSDNGAPAGNASRNDPLRGNKGTLREGGLRVPFLVRWKDGGVPAGKVVEEPVSALDIVPTTFAAAGVSVPEKPGLDGVDLLPFLRGKSSTVPHDHLCWRYGRQAAVRKGSWKLVRAAAADPNKPGSKPEEEATPPWELYDVSADPGEGKELSKENPDKVRELRQIWEEWDRGNVPPLWHYNTPVPGMEAKDEVGG